MRAAALAAAAAVPLFTLHDPRLDELSGIARGITSPHVLYVQNDSGDRPRFFALDPASGRVVAEYDVPGARNVDWEDLAVAPDRSGRASVWLGDIGDNDSVRSTVQIYRVPEPHVRSARQPISTARAAAYELRYPDGAHDAESLAVSPAGRAYVITKNPRGRAGVYAVPSRPSSRVQTMTRIATITLPSGGGLIPDSYQVEATGAALSADGSRFVVRTYTAAYLWAVRDGDLAAALRARPRRIQIPLQQQGEGVCFDGDRLLLDSEGVGTPVFAVPLPAAPRTVPSRPPERSSAQPAPSPRPSAGRAAASRSSDTAPVLVGAALGAALAMGTGAAVRKRRRRG